MNEGIIKGFAPIAAKDARILILGSMPSVRSLELNQYYAHRQNAFWRIMEALYGMESESDYTVRSMHLKSHGIALWDVLKSCIRPGSMDADIDSASIKINDFDSFLVRYRHIHRIVFNGAAAEKYFLGYVRPVLHADSTALEFVRAPSTSPANARYAFKDKVAAWRDALGTG